MFASKATNSFRDYGIGLLYPPNAADVTGRKALLCFTNFGALPVSDTQGKLIER